MGHGGVITPYIARSNFKNLVGSNINLVGLSSEGVRCFSPQVCIASVPQSPMRAEAPHYFRTGTLRVTAYYEALKTESTVPNSANSKSSSLPHASREHPCPCRFVKTHQPHSRQRVAGAATVTGTENKRAFHQAAIASE